jgi:hypothetical protein
MFIFAITGLMQNDQFTSSNYQVLGFILVERCNQFINSYNYLFVITASLCSYRWKHSKANGLRTSAGSRNTAHRQLILRSSNANANSRWQQEVRLG